MQIQTTKLEISYVTRELIITILLSHNFHTVLTTINENLSIGVKMFEYHVPSITAPEETTKLVGVHYVSKQ